MAQGEVITFYSYKGGVGRSMALANAATLLAQTGKRVLAMDFDLEAPGLLRYFQRVEAPGSGAGGVIEFFSELRRRFQESRGRASGAAGSDALPSGALGLELEDELRGAVISLVEDPRFFRRVTVANPNLPGEVAQLSLMPAGHYDATYPDRVRKFPWDAFYETHPYFVEFLIDALTERYDYVLVDSRTGTTDVGNLCTVLLPEKLVLVSTPNEQSLNGATEVGRQAVEMRKASADLRPLPLFPLLSRVENAEDSLQRTWIRDAQSRFETVFSQVYGIKRPLTVYFDTVQIPHKSFYAYGEVIAAERERLTEARSLVAAYREFVDALLSNNAVDAQELMSARIVSPSKAQEAASVAQQRTVLLAEKVLVAEARTLDLEQRLQELQPAASDVPLEVTSSSEASDAPRRGRTTSWLPGAVLGGLGVLGGVWFWARPARMDAAALIERSSNRQLEPTVSSPRADPLREPPATSASAWDPALSERMPPKVSPVLPPSQQSATSARRPQASAAPALRAPRQPRKIEEGGAPLTAEDVEQPGPDPALLQIVRGDLQREKVNASVSPDTFSGSTLVLGSYTSPAQARTNLARIRNSLRDAQVYYSTNRFYAVAVPAASEEGPASAKKDSTSQLALAARVSPDAYFYEAHDWLEVAFK